jgi:pimeloyl-ACP methyl ester carboxylesterase
MQTYIELEVNGKILRGYFHKPQGEAKDIVVMFHGFTGHKNENSYMFRTLSRMLEAESVASLRFDFSGSGDSDGDFKDMTYFTELEEAKAILEFACHLTDCQKVIALGFSMGGAVLAQASLAKKDLIKKMILVSAAGNMKDLFKRLTETNRPVGDSDVDMGGYAMSKMTYESLKDFDLYANISTFDRPVLIIHGEQDTAVPLAYGQKYASLYLNARMHVIAGAPHGYSTMEMRSELYQTIINYILREGD